MQRLSDYTRELKAARTSAVDFGRLIQTIACSTRQNQGTPDINAALEMAKAMDAPRVMAALESMRGGNASVEELLAKGAIAGGATTDASWGVLSPQVVLGSEFIDYQRAQTVIDRLPNSRRIPFNTLTAAISTGSSARFVGQGYPTPVAKLDAAAALQGFSKLSVIIPYTGDLARNTSIDAAKIIAADAAAAVAAGADQALLDPDSDLIAGIRPSSVTKSGTQIASTGLTCAQITADCKSAMRAIDAARIPINRCCWIITQDVFSHLATLNTLTTGELAFDDIEDDPEDGGFIAGLPLLVSGNAFGAASASEGLIILLDPQSLALADSGTASVDITTTAAIQMDTSPSTGAQTLTSLWSQDMVAARVSRYINWSLLRTAGCVTIRGVNV